MGPSNVPANWLTDIGMGMYHTDTYVPPEGVSKVRVNVDPLTLKDDRYAYEFGVFNAGAHEYVIGGKGSKPFSGNNPVLSEASRQADSQVLLQDNAANIKSLVQSNIALGEIEAAIRRIDPQAHITFAGDSLSGLQFLNHLVLMAKKDPSVADRYSLVSTDQPFLPASSLGLSQSALNNLNLGGSCTFLATSGDVVSQGTLANGGWSPNTLTLIDVPWVNTLDTNITVRDFNVVYEADANSA
ncbi:MAG TPA: hypothetical protein VN631_11595, partial [Negativicutes bacterium]|nr:hypothetical protein [Negativicutes bacterium]